ncbi:MAG TPA: CotH kinase family protein, partial [Candidatus Acidoferrum sp.]|nr:CotH kinase family protein [Candidatus Acidoferrum sp.]
MGAIQNRTLGIISTVLMAASAFGAETKANKPVPGADIFDNKHVLPITIEISTNELKALQRDARRYARATVREGTNVWNEVGIHLKGAAGSFRGIDDKPALTLHFSKFTPDQKFHGLKKIHLNNSVQDASYMTENLCGELFRRAGVPAARVSYATVVFNGRKKGVYVLKEGFEKEMLGLYFNKTKGNLYDGGFLREITDPLERDEGQGDDVDKWADLKALAAAAQSTNVLTRFDDLSKVLDMERFISFVALEIMMWDWDGYVLNRNNYRVFHDMGSNRMVFFPHGMDQMFWHADAPIYPNMNGLVAQAVVKTHQGRQAYRERFEQIF